MSKGNLRRRLEAARQEIGTLTNEEAYSSEWRSWYSSTLTLLGDAYGINSEELDGFQTIRFEFEAPTLRAEEIFHQVLPEVARPQIPREPYFRQRLSEADDYLQSLLLGLPPEAD